LIDKNGTLQLLAKRLKKHIDARRFHPRSNLDRSALVRALKRLADGLHLLSVIG
jgi:hypothetical protein